MTTSSAYWKCRFASKNITDGGPPHRTCIQAVVQAAASKKNNDVLISGSLGERLEVMIVLG